MHLFVRALAIAVVTCATLLPAFAQHGALTRPPELLHTPPVDYPPELIGEIDEGHVDFMFTITTDGAVHDLVVIAATDARLVSIAEVVVRQFVFRPAEVDGLPTSVRIEYRYHVRIDEVMVPATTATLDGCVVDSLSQPREGVRVYSPERFDLVTGPDGCFSVEVEPGRVEVFFEHPDYPTLALAEDLDAGMTLAALYELDEFLVADPSDDDEGDDFELVIRIPRVRREAVAVEFRAEEARRMAGTQGDVLRVVEQMAGVGRSAAGSGSLVVWGASPEDTRVYVDGVRLPRLYHTGGYRTVLPGSFVRQVSLFPGAYGASYGRGLGALILVEMTDLFEGRASFSGDVTVDVFDAGASVVAHVHRDVAASLAVRRGHLHEVVRGAGAVGLVSPQSPALLPEYVDVAARLVWRTAPTDRAELRVLYSGDNASRTVEDPDPARRIDETRELHFGRLSAHWTRTLADGTTLSVVSALGWDRHDRLDALGGLGASSSLSTVLGSLRGVMRQELGRHTVEAGMDVDYEQATVERSGAIGAPPREGDPRVFGQPPPDQIGADRWRATQVGVAPYLQTTLRSPESRWELSSGLRVDPYYRSSSRRLPPEGDAPPVGVARQDFGIEPRASIMHRPFEALEFRLSGGRFHQFALQEDTSAVFGNPDLRTARGTHLVFTSTYRPLDSLTIEGTTFSRSTERLTVRSPADAPPRAEALVPQGEGRSRGLQTEIRYDQESVQLRLAYTLSRSERRSAPGERWRPFDQDQPHIVNATLGLKLPGNWHLSGRFSLASGFPRTDVVGAYYDAQRDAWRPLLGSPNAIRLPISHQLDLRAERTWEHDTGAVSLWLDVQNALNSSNPEEYVYNADYTQRTTVSGLPLLVSIGARYQWSP